jgi:hypothetical protein
MSLTHETGWRRPKVTIEEFIGKIATAAVAEFANSEWYIQYSDVEQSVSLHVAAGAPDEPTQGYSFNMSAIEHLSPEDADGVLKVGIRSIAERTAIRWTGGYD